MPSRKVDPSDPLPLYYQVYSSLLERIQAGEFPPGCQLPTERQLTEEYGVSRITVVKSLDMLERDGYVDRQHGRGTFLATPAKVASIEPAALPAVALNTYALGHVYLSGILAGVAAVCGHRGYLLQVFGSVHTSQDEAAGIREALARKVQGLILTPWSEYQNLDLLREFQAGGPPLVLIDRYYPELATDYVVFDDRQAGYDLTTHLIAKGHRRIAFISNPEIKPTSVRDRLAGYRQALESHDVQYDDDLVWFDLSRTFSSDGEVLGATPAMHELLRRHVANDRPTALLAVNYDVAAVLSEALPLLGLVDGRGCRPETDHTLVISAISHKLLAPNTPFVSALAMQSGQTLGMRAMELLAGRLDGSVQGEYQHIQLPMEILDFEVDPAPVLPVPAAPVAHEGR